MLSFVIYTLHLLLVCLNEGNELDRKRSSCMEELRDCCSILIVIPEGKRPLWRPRRRWENYITMDLKEVVRRGMV
jgi:hypothetical protein